jgi:hypothetical protein
MDPRKGSPIRIRLDAPPVAVNPHQAPSAPPQRLCPQSRQDRQLKPIFSVQGRLRATGKRRTAQHSAEPRQTNQSQQSIHQILHAYLVPRTIILLYSQWGLIPRPETDAAAIILAIMRDPYIRAIGRAIRKRG